MSPEASHDPTRREPVYSGTRRVRGLTQRQLADGTIVFETRPSLNGTKRRVVLDATTKTDAIRELEALRTDYRRGVAVETTSLLPSVAELAADYLAHLDARIGHRDPAKRYSPRTVALYRGRLNGMILPSIGKLRSDELDARHLRRMVEALGLCYAPGTVTSCLNITSGLCRWAVKNHLMARNVTRDLDRDDRPGSRRQTEPRYLAAGQVEQLLAAMGDTYRPIAATCAYAGLRISEALGLLWSDVDLDAGTIRVQRQLDDDLTTRADTKTPASTATLTILPALQRELREHRARQRANDLRRGHRSQLVFSTLRGQPQSRRNALRAVHRAGDAAGLNPEGAERVGLHDLRHSLIALALAGGMTPPEAARLARHANPGVTMAMYAGLTDADRARVWSKLGESGFGR
jgi:integrase